MIPVIETPRLKLRGWQASDLAPLAEFYAHPSAAFVGGPLAHDETWRSLACFIGHWELRGFGLFVMEERTTGTMVGYVGPYFPEGWPEQEIGWSVLPARRRQGFAAEGARAAMTFAYEQLGWTTAISLIRENNAASQGTARKLGASFEKWVELRGVRQMIFRHLPPDEWAAGQSSD